MSTEDRLKRSLAMVPWIVAHDGPTVDETCARFGCTPPELMRDIELLYLCGLYPYTPDVLIEASVADGRVYIEYAEYFSRPLRLTPGERWERIIRHTITTARDRTGLPVDVPRIAR